MHSINRRVLTVVALGVFVIAMASAGPATATPSKPFSLVLASGVPASGSTASATVTAKIHNETSTQQVGSANLTAPAVYTLGTTATASQGTATVVGNTVQLRNLALMPKQFLTVTITIATSPCVTEPWSIVAKQSNDFSGLPGNDLTLDLANSTLNTAVCAVPCNKNSTCSTNGSISNGEASVTAPKSKNTGQLFESANASNVEPLTCKKPDGSDYMSADPNTYGVFATVDRTKVVTITITNPTVSIPLSQQQVCFDAPYQFGTATGAPLLPDGNGGFIGLLQTCTKSSVGPCLDRANSTQTGSTVTLVVDIPSGLPQDPHMN